MIRFAGCCGVLTPIVQRITCIFVTWCAFAEWYTMYIVTNAIRTWLIRSKAQTNTDSVSQFASVFLGLAILSTELPLWTPDLDSIDWSADSLFFCAIVACNMYNLLSAHWSTLSAEGISTSLLYEIWSASPVWHILLVPKCIFNVEYSRCACYS